MAISKLVALFFAFAAVASTLQPSEARVQGFPSVDQEETAPSKTAAQAGGNPGTPLPQIPGLPFAGFPFPLPTIPGLPPLVGPLPGAPGAPPAQGLPGLPHLPIPGAPGAPPSQGLLPGLPHLPIPGAAGAPPSQGLPGLPHLPLPAAAAPTPPPPAECLTPLTQMFPCIDYLTNITVTTPPAMCCDGLKSVIGGAPICLCHGMNGDMGKLFPNPIDPIRMFILPLRCGAMPPLRTLLACNSQTVPPLVPPTTPTPPASPVSPAPPLVGPRSPAPATSPASAPTAELSP